MLIELRTAGDHEDGSHVALNCMVSSCLVDKPSKRTEISVGKWTFARSWTLSDQFLLSLDAVTSSMWASWRSGGGGPWTWLRSSERLSSAAWRTAANKRVSRRIQTTPRVSSTDAWHTSTSLIHCRTSLSQRCVCLNSCILEPWQLRKFHQSQWLWCNMVSKAWREEGQHGTYY